MKSSVLTPVFAIVIPAYNESGTISDVISRVPADVASIIIVDDASTDNTADLVRPLPVTLLTHAENQGKSAALWTGMQAALSAGSKAIITLDGDGQHNPEDIPFMIEAYCQHPESIIIAARALDRKNAPYLRRFANRFADFWISWAAGYRIFDSQSGFRIYPEKLLKNLQISTENGRNFVFESEIMIEAAWRGVYSIGVPVRSIYAADRRASHYKPFGDTWAIVKMVAIRLKQKKFPLRGLIRSIFGKVRWVKKSVN